MASSSSKSYDWKILALGRGLPGAKAVAKEVEEHLKSLGYPNVTADASIENNAASDEKLIALLKQTDWDAVSIGGALNGYDERFERELTTLHWFNRLVNLIHEHAPKAKLIFVDKPEAMTDGIHRILGSGHE